jgi:UDP-N-acetylglucosamine 2-epimerase
VHRAENTEDPAQLRAIVAGLDRIASSICPVIWPVHPRTKKCLAEIGCAPGSVTAIEPASYFEMLLLESRAQFILTDSGGVQKEAYFLRVPCITLREETEWEETLANHCNVLVGSCGEKMVEAATAVSKAGPWTAIYGDGKAGVATLDALRAAARAR